MEHSPEAAIEFVEQAGKPWRIVLKNFDTLQAALGRDVLRAFCRCFVHADRLTSTISSIHASEQLHGRESVAFDRDLHTLVWFTIGTLRELALAIRELRAALARHRKFDPDSSTWQELRDVEKRWEDDESFRRMRDKAAFHVDPEVIDKGLDELVKHRDVDLARGDGRKSVDASLTLGLEAMHNGLGLTLEEYGKFLGTVSADHGVAVTIQEAFVLACQSAGVPFSKP
jgi:hypothetical protein